MANPQLTSYIKQQLGSGDNESSIKNNLRSVGWAESDIVDAFKESSPVAAVPPMVAAKPISPSPIAPAFTPQTTQPMANPSPAAPAMPSAPKVAAPTEPRKINLEAFAPMSSPSPVARPFSASPAIVSFTAQKPMENIFQPKAANPGPAVPGMNPNPMVAAPLSSMAPMAVAPKKSWGSAVVTIFMVLLIIGLGGLSWLLYQNNSALKSQVNTIMTQLNSLTGEQSSNSQTLASQIAALQDDNKDLDAQLVLFLPRSATSTSTTTLKGIIGGGGKLNYTLTTSKGIVVNIKNSKDAKIVATLGPQVGLSAVLTGIPTAGAREITVTLVNGFEPSLPPPPPAATTTPPAATSTTP